SGCITASSRRRTAEQPRYSGKRWTGWKKTRPCKPTGRISQKRAARQPNTRSTALRFHPPQNSNAKLADNPRPSRTETLAKISALAFALTIPIKIWGGPHKRSLCGGQKFRIRARGIYCLQSKQPTKFRILRLLCTKV